MITRCGGDLYVRGYIRSIAQAVGTDPEPLIRQYNTAQPAPQAITDEAAEPVTFTRTGEWLWRAWFALVALVAVGLWFVAFHTLAGSRHATSAVPSARAHPVTHRPAGHGSQAPPAPKTATRVPSGSARSPRPQPPRRSVRQRPRRPPRPRAPRDRRKSRHGMEHQLVHHRRLRGTRTRGTGLLVDMGRPTTITAAQITLGNADGASFQLRVGAAPTLADLPPCRARSQHRRGGAPAAHHTGARPLRAHLVHQPATRPRPCMFQASVYNLRLEGRS